MSAAPLDRWNDVHGSIRMKQAYEYCASNSEHTAESRRKSGDLRRERLERAVIKLVELENDTNLG